MKKSCKFLAIALLFVASSAHAEKVMRQAECPATELTESFVQGFVAGGLAGGIIDLARSYAPDLKEDYKIDLYTSFGICRDQLTGMGKIVAAILGAKFICDGQCESEDTDTPVCNKANLTAKLLGAVVGACAVSYAQKLCSSCKSSAVVAS
jgi:hypothetical protein